MALSTRPVLIAHGQIIVVFILIFRCFNSILKLSTNDYRADFELQYADVYPE